MKQRRLRTMILLLAILCGVLSGGSGQRPDRVQAGEEIYSGRCGGEVYWQLLPDEDGYALWISGTGEMQHFATPDAAPWYKYRQQIHTLTLEEGITGIGNRAFYGCAFTGGLTLPETLEEIGHYAFYGCTGFSGELVIPPSVKEIGAYAFYRTGFDAELCLSEGLTEIGIRAFANSRLTGEVKLPQTLKKIGARAFYQCRGLEGVLVIPKGVQSVGRSAFYGCTGIREVHLYADAEIGRDAFAVAFQGTIYNLSASVEEEELALDWRYELGAVYSVYGVVNGTEYLLGKVLATEKGAETYPLPEELKEAGFLLEGWYMEETLTTPWNPTAELTGNVVLYAKLKEGRTTPAPTKQPEVTPEITAAATAAPERPTDVPEVTPAATVLPTGQPESTPQEVPSEAPTIPPAPTRLPEPTEIITPPVAPTRPPETTPEAAQLPTAVPEITPAAPPIVEPTKEPAVTPQPVAPSGSLPVPTETLTGQPTGTQSPEAPLTAAPTAVQEKKSEPEKTKDETAGTLGLGLIYTAAGIVLAAVLVLLRKIKRSEL